MFAKADERGGRWVLIVVIAALATLLVACGDDGADTEATPDTVEEAAGDARQEAENAFASLRTDAERLFDEIRTRNAPEVKQTLLDRCRDVVERLRQADSPNADRVDDLCNRIRDTDVKDAAAWQHVQDELAKLPQS